MGMYAFAGRKDFYGKKAFIVIAFAPIVVWSIVLAVLNCLLCANGSGWFVRLMELLTVKNPAVLYGRI
ncbi:MAG: metalloprotease family protein [Eubacterium sp.]